MYALVQRANLLIDRPHKLTKLAKDRQSRGDIHHFDAKKSSKIMVFQGTLEAESAVNNRPILPLMVSKEAV